MNLNGKNGLACITPLSAVVKGNKLVVRPLPGLPVIRDLVVDMSIFYKQYEKVRPFLQNDSPAPDIERMQSPDEREKLDGLYERDRQRVVTGRSVSVRGALGVRRIFKRQNKQ